MSPGDAARAAAARASTGARRAAHRTFRSLAVRNYRLYFIGQAVSQTGTWMQSVAQAWLVLQLTGSGVALGLTTALQFGPILFLGPWGGVLADRLDKRRLLMGTQTAAGALAGVLGGLTIAGVVEPWMVYVIAGAFGIVTAIDNPARQSFVVEMVGRRDLANAVSLNSVLLNAARVVGPGVAGLLIATVGTGLCFLLNAASYVAVVAALWRMRSAELLVGERVARSRGQLREGLRYVARSPSLRRPLLLMLVVGTLGFNLSTLLPLFATESLHQGAGGYGVLFSVMGLGAVGGGLVIAFRGSVGDRLMAGSAALFGVSLALVGIMPNLPAALAAMIPCGVANTAFISTSNSLLQAHATPAMRGRVMALFGMVFLGTTPIGAPLAGLAAETLGPRAALALAGAAVVAAAAATGWAIHRSPSVSEPARTPEAEAVPATV
ncbi:MAG: MFS transporter [Actinomycetota bacterium]